MANKWLSLEQTLSHEGKSLKEHIKEIKSFLLNFLKFYGLWERYHKIAEFLAEYHDY